MAQYVYEGMFILDANRYGRDPDTVSSSVNNLLQKYGAEMLVSRLWEERRLAYPIKGQKKGIYWLTYFRLDSQHLGELRRQCMITDDILRVLFLRVDVRIVDALVSHALSAPTFTAPAEESSAKEEPVAVAEGTSAEEAATEE